MRATSFLARAFAALALVVLVGGSATAAQLGNQKNEVLSSYSIEPKSDGVMRQVAGKFEVTRRVGTRFEVIVPANQAQELLTLVPNAKLIYADIKDEIRNAQRHNPDWRAGYHSFSAVETQLKDWAAKYASLATLSTYGKSKQGRPLYVFELSGIHPTMKVPPEIMITAATHGDELITVEVVLGIMQRLLEGYSTEARLRDIVDKHKIYFVPVVNVDGFVAQDRYDSGVDPNRSYPWPESPSNRPSPAIGPLIEFFQTKNIVASIDYHASGEMVMFPWAYTYQHVPEADYSAMTKLTDGMAKFNGYAAGPISEVIYIAKGSSADYYYWKKKSYALGIEMAQSKMPSVSQIPNILKDNWDSTLYFLESFN